MDESRACPAPAFLRLLRPLPERERRPTDLTLNPAAKWLGLDVRSRRVVDADRTEVEFVARLRESVRVVRMHERSRFVRASGRWFYVDGDQF